MNVSVPDTAVCLQCGYSLRGLAELRCPECGRAFDPTDPSTLGPQPQPPRLFKWTGPLPRWLQWWGAPPPRWHVYGITAFTLALLFYSGSPRGLRSGDSREGPLIAQVVYHATPAFSMAMGFDYFVRVLVVGDNRRSGTRKKTELPRGRASRWVITPFCLLLILTAVGSDWPRVLRLSLSRPAFERVAQACLHAREQPKGPQWIGLYHVRRISTRRPGVVVFQVEAGTGEVDAVGFVYDPGNLMLRPYGPSMAPGWYIDTW